MEGVSQVDDLSQRVVRPRVAVPPDWRAELREITAGMGRSLVEELLVMVGCTMWWISCLGVAGGAGFLLAEWPGLVVGLLVGSSVAVAGWLVGMAHAVRDLVLTWRSPGLRSGRAP